MQYYNNELAVEPSWMIREGILTDETYRHLTRRKKVRVIRRACKNTPALVAFDSIPDRLRKLIELEVGDPYKAAAVNQVEILIKPNQEALELFENFRLPDGRYLKPETRREYYANAIVLDAVHRLISDKKAKRSALGHKSTRAWEQISDAVQDLDRNKYPHRLPTSGRRLEDRYRQYKSGGPEILIHSNFMNKSSAKIDDEIKESFLLELISDPRNLDNEQVRNFYNQVAEKMGWKKISASTVAVWRDKFDLASYAGRRGSVAFSNTKAMQVKRSAPTAPLYFLTLDGWDAELLYQKTDSGRTTYHHRPTIVLVLDAFLKYPIGYAIGTHEEPSLIREALRSAMRHTVELFGGMHRAHQIQSDRYSIKQMTPYYETIADKSTPARVKNAKSKVIEPYFNRINKTYCQLMPNWSGYGITGDKDKQPNIEYLNKYRKDFPDFDGVCRQIEHIINLERASKRDKYVEKWNQLKDADKLTMPAERYLLAFGEQTSSPIMLRGSGLHPTIGGIKRDYDCFDLQFREHYSQRWTVKYDPADLTQILAVSEDESLRFILTEKYVQPMALKERKPGDSEQLQAVHKYNKAIEEKVIEQRANAAELVRAAIADNPQLEDTTLRKLLIVDSQGQHKRRLGEAKRALPPSSEAQQADSEEDYFNMY